MISIFQKLLIQRDNRFEVSTAEKKKNRADIPIPAVLPGASAWENKEISQFMISDKAAGTH